MCDVVEIEPIMSPQPLQPCEWCVMSRNREVFFAIYLLCSQETDFLYNFVWLVLQESFTKGEKF